MAKEPSPSAELATALQRVFDLSAADQLRAYKSLRAYLAEDVEETEADQRIDERAAALDAMRMVAEHLKLAPGVAPTPAQFDTGARLVAPGWDRSRVVRAWRRWRWAKRAFIGERTPEPAARKARRRATGPPRKYEDHLTAVRLWLKTSPASETIRDYQAWAGEYNQARRPDELVVPKGTSSITTPLRLSWKDVVRVGKGEISLEDAPRIERQRRETFTRGPHDLISLETALEIVKRATGRYVDVRTTYRQGFPVPVIVKGRKRVWLRGDAEAFAAGKPTPERRENELGDEYIDAVEVAQLVGVKVGTIKRTGSPRTPPPVANIAAFELWLRSEVEEHVRAWQRDESG